jgi:DNA repair protein RadC
MMDEFDQVRLFRSLPRNFLFLEKEEELIEIARIRLDRVDRETLLDREILKESLANSLRGGRMIHHRMNGLNFFS